MNPVLAVIIVSWNTADLLRQCLKSVEQNRGQVNGKVIVVDNASSDKTVDMIRSEFPQVKVIQNLSNVGFAKANNIALDYLFKQPDNSDLVLFPNSDVVLLINDIE